MPFVQYELERQGGQRWEALIIHNMWGWRQKLAVAGFREKEQFLFAIEG